MPEHPFIARSWLKVTCPFSFKFLLFMTESGLLDQIEIVCCDPDAGDFEALRDQLAELTGARASFPTVEIEPGVFMSESDDLIRYFAEKNGVSLQDLPVLDWYKAGLFNRVIGMHREIRDLKEQLGQ